MINFIRTLKFGTINFFGVVLPGFLLIFFSIVGFFLPALTVILYVSNSNWSYFEPLYLDTKWILAIIVILFSYVFGYILRLISPDELDDVSGKIVLDKYKKESDGSLNKDWPKNWEEDGWPFSGEEGDKFPYYYFHRYLEKRNLREQTKELVMWGPPNKDGSFKQRSKTAVNKMKMDVMLYCPEFAGLIDSNEAHVRLMAGTWSSIRYTYMLVKIGLIISSIAMSLIVILLLFKKFLGIPIPYFTQESPLYLINILLSFSLLKVMTWARKEIESLFHYRRVNELFFIVQAACYANDRKKANDHDQRFECAISKLFAENYNVVKNSNPLRAG